MAKRKNPMAVALGKRGAAARLTKMTPEQRKDVARKGAAARWESQAPGGDPFAGDLDPARQRLRDLTVVACEVLDASPLNALSFHLATYVDHEAGNRVLTDRMTAELKVERETAATSTKPQSRKAKQKPAAKGE